ncbi:aspartate/glutamate racemase family protein [Saccharibacillus kuerlensis]|uniref:Racemase n=1 Tax=Saccharibacillus kuerlensis TaxID=459527 RepID=A0ABQ2KSH7_9BACL|nr:aspartate/glutamate racemase family protein [Saccharibacillus kuerlensis]GGN91879.1 racemase [Saccharibacillus kuerlensis]
MKKIGLIGGMSWESSAEYYRLINEEVKQKRGGLHSAECILYSVDFAEIERFQAEGDWESAGRKLGAAASSLERAGADFIVLCTNTMHKVAEAIEAEADIPLLHIADVTAEAVRAAGLQTVGLLGTRYTMEQDFYRSAVEAHGIDVLTPDEGQRAEVNRIIYEELCLGEIRESSRDYYAETIRGLMKQGAEGIIFGCTEIGLLIGPQDSQVPVFDTTKLHAKASVHKALDLPNL